MATSADDPRLSTQDVISPFSTENSKRSTTWTLWMSIWTWLIWQSKGSSFYTLIPKCFAGEYGPLHTCSIDHSIEFKHTRTLADKTVDKLENEKANIWTSISNEHSLASRRSSRYSSSPWCRVITNDSALSFEPCKTSIKQVYPIQAIAQLSLTKLFTNVYLRRAFSLLQLHKCDDWKANDMVVPNALSYPSNEWTHHAIFNASWTTYFAHDTLAIVYVDEVIIRSKTRYDSNLEYMGAKLWSTNEFQSLEMRCWQTRMKWWLGHRESHQNVDPCELEIISYRVIFTTTKVAWYHPEFSDYIRWCHFDSLPSHCIALTTILR